MSVETLMAELQLFTTPLLYNLYFALAAIPLGFVIAVALAVLRMSRLPVLSPLAGLIIYAFRGSPFFIQLFFAYTLVLSLNLSVWKPLGVDGLVLNPLVLGPLVLALNTGAYTAAIFAGAWQQVDEGEAAAARAFGLGPVRQFTRVTWPGLIRIAWPAYSNEVVFAFQATALIYFTLPVIGGQEDVMRTAQTLYSRDFNLLLHYGTAALCFLAVSQVIFVTMGLVGRRLNRHLPQRRAPRRLLAPLFSR